MTAVVKKQTALPLRNDTILGICEALGQDFGINPTWFRLAFIAPLFFAPMWTVLAYLALGGVVAISRWAYPRTVVDAPSQEAEIEQTVEADDYRIAA